MQGFPDPAQTRAIAVALDDRARLPWRFLARYVTVDALALS